MYVLSLFFYAISPTDRFEKEILFRDSFLLAYYPVALLNLFSIIFLAYTYHISHEIGLASIAEYSTNFIQSRMKKCNNFYSQTILLMSTLQLVLFAYIENFYYMNDDNFHYF